MNKLKILLYILFGVSLLFTISPNIFIKEPLSKLKISSNVASEIKVNIRICNQGFLIDSLAPDHSLEYTYIQGCEGSYYISINDSDYQKIGYMTPGILSSDTITINKDHQLDLITTSIKVDPNYSFVSILQILALLVLVLYPFMFKV